MNRALLEEQDWEYNESLRIDREREEEFLREAFAIPKVEAKVEAKESDVAKEPKEPKETKVEPDEEPKLTASQLRNARIQFYEKKIDLKKYS
jgi:hypothetical protein